MNRVYETNTYRQKTCAPGLQREFPWSPCNCSARLERLLEAVDHNEIGKGDSVKKEMKRTLDERVHGEHQQQ